MRMQRPWLTAVAAALFAVALPACDCRDREQPKEVGASPEDLEKMVRAAFFEGFAEEGRAARAALEARDAGPPPSLEEMVLVPEGEFWFGCDRETDRDCRENEESYRRVHLSDFYIDRTEVTVASYAECVGAGVCNEPIVSDSWLCDTEARNWDQPGRDRHPVNCVTWQQAEAYCRFRDKRLPSTEEWEKAARGTDGRLYPWGNEPPTCELAVWAEGRNRRCNDHDGTFEVGSRPKGASPYGILDMAGNVEEWTTLDTSGPVDVVVEGTYYHRDYRLKGGHYASDADDLRASVHSWSQSAIRRAWLVGSIRGFRCAYSPHTRPTFEPGTWVPDVE